MANIIVSTFTNLPSTILDSFRQGFIDALVAEGNNVLLFITNQFLANHNAGNTLAKNIDKHQLIASLKDFKPDLFISVNHSGLFPSLAESLECPIAIWLLDGPSYLVDAEECRQKRNRYQMYIATRAFRNDLNESFGISNQNIHDLPLASDFQTHPIEIAHNISFVGTNFTGHKFQEIIKQLGSNRFLISKLRDLLSSYRSDKNMIFSQRLKIYGLENIFVGEFDEAYILNTISINKRIKVLDAVEDLGLILYGTSDWPETMKYSLGLALSFDPSPVLTKSDLENIYNASKLSLNVSHSQARGGLPWRIFDVMATNSVLLSDFQEDLVRLFGKDNPIAIYESPAEARDIGKRLLKDEPHRKFIAESCNQIINSGHRFKHRLKQISEMSDINLLPEGTGQLTNLHTENHRSAKQPLSRLSQILHKSIKEKNKQEFSLQLFQSALMNFAADNSKLQRFQVPEDKKLTCEFHLSQALPFIRLDIGEYFSKHRNVEVTISEYSSTDNSLASQIIDLKKDIVQSNDFHLTNNELYCGYDSFCVFENPYPNKDIKVTFESLLITGL